MKLSYHWLKEFVDVPADPRNLKSKLTGLGLGVESVSPFDEDWILDVEVTTNRPDCLSHYGVARELSTAYDTPLKKLEVVLKEMGPAVSGSVSIEILNPELCARYCGRVLRKVEVKPSPDWLARRLEAMGQRSINNIADATNYVLLELGHPLHAFDLKLLSQHKILVRRAQAGESLRTLDGIDRKLTSHDLVIADAGRPVALAGIMGGEDSAITESTRFVLLESAWFDPVTIRRTAKAQGMHTEASHRFERGADIEMAPLALDRCAQLVQQLAGGEILRGMLDVYPHPLKREKIQFERREMRRVLGSEVPWEEVERILRSLGFQVERRGTEAWGVTPPSFRLDVTREVDLIEEVARHFGYDRLPARLIPAPPSTERDLQREKEWALSGTLVSLGYREIIASSMVDPAENQRYGELASIVLENPLSQEASALRTTAVPSMLAALRWNLDRDREDLRFFETGKVYWRGKEGRPEERRVLTLGLAGHRRAASVHESAKDLDFFDLKGDLETVWDLFDLAGLSFCPQGEGYYENGLRGEYHFQNVKLAAFGQLATGFAKDYKLKRPVWLAEIDLERLLERPLKSRAFQPYSRFPAVERDFSLLIPQQVTYQRIAQTLCEFAPSEVVSFRPVDLFYGSSKVAGEYSLLLRVTFQRMDHTLTGEEVAAASQKILSALASLNIRLRA